MTSSYRHILRATSIIGGATFGALAISLIRNKAVALIGGPEALGLFGLFTTLIAAAGSVATVGLDTSGVRALSQALDEPARASSMRRAIWSLAWLLAISGGLAMWLFSEPLASYALGDARLSSSVAWLGTAVAATVVGATQIASLQSYGRLGDIARLRLWGSAIATAVGVAAIYQLQLAGILLAAIALPLVNVLLALRFTSRLPRLEARSERRAAFLSEWRALLSIGATVMLTYALVNLCGLAVRAIITHQLGLYNAGLYQASSAIISVNLTLLLNAMASDYYPRLSKVGADTAAATEILNQQLHISLLLAAPALLVAMLAATPLLQLLYSGEFSRSTLLLRIFVAAAVPRLALWTLSYVLLARGARLAFLLSELAAAAVVPLTWLFVPRFGLAGAGLAAVLANLLAFVVYAERASSLGVALSAENLRYAASLFALFVGLALMFEINLTAGLVAALCVAGPIGWKSFRELRAVLRQ